LSLTQNRAFQTYTPGPAGTNTFGIVQERLGTRVINPGFTAQVPSAPQVVHNAFRNCAGCFMCGSNNQLAFRPRLFADTNFHGFVMPASRPVQVRAHGKARESFHLLPTPFCALLVPFSHTRKPGNTGDDIRSNGSFHLGVNNTWTGETTHLLRLVPDLTPDQPFSVHHQFGHEAGARPQGWEQNADANEWGPHGFMRVTYGRERLRELGDANITGWLPDLLASNPITTANFGLDAILHFSRVAAGSLPADDQVLWDLWEPFAGEEDDIEQYHRGVLAMAAA